MSDNIDVDHHWKSSDDSVSAIEDHVMFLNSMSDPVQPSPMIDQLTAWVFGQRPTYSRSDSSFASGSEAESISDESSTSLTANLDDDDDDVYSEGDGLRCPGNDVGPAMADFDLDELIASLVDGSDGNQDFLVLDSVQHPRQYDAHLALSAYVNQDGIDTRLPKTVMEMNDKRDKEEVYQSVEYATSLSSSFSSSSPSSSSSTSLDQDIKTLLREKLRKRGIDIESIPLNERPSGKQVNINIHIVYNCLFVCLYNL